MQSGKTLGIAACGFLAAVAALLLLTRPSKPDDFYVVDQAPGGVEPGRLIRAAAFAQDVPAGARAWRILYATTRANGEPAMASGIVMARAKGSGLPRPLIAWAHGTTGVEPGCAPSLLAPFANVPALEALLQKDWVYVATDYVGLGTAGPHPYLIGPGQARSVLDAVRAARQVEGLRLADSTVVWGHSQGGHAALWTGSIAGSYAPDVQVVGVAAAAPASDLAELITRIQSSLAGRLTTSYLLESYAGEYPDVGFDEYSAGGRGYVAQVIAGRCLAGRSAIGAIAAALLAPGGVFTASPVTGTLGQRLRENIPAAPIAAPVFIAQGLEDKLVLPDVQAGYVHTRCRAGQPIRYVQYRGRDHLSLVAAASPYEQDLIEWTERSFAGLSAQADCSVQER